MYKKPQYKIVAIFKDTKARGMPLEVIGLYNPMSPNKMFFVNMERLGFWAYKGAVVSDKVVKLLGIFSSSLFITKSFKKFARTSTISKEFGVRQKVKPVKKKSNLPVEENFVSLLNKQADYSQQVKFARKFWARKNFKSNANSKEISSE